MPEALDLLRQEHRNLATLLRALEWQVAAFSEDSHPDYEVIRATVDYFLDFPDLCHHPKEDLVFARLRQRDPAAAERVGDLKHAHEQLGFRARDFASAIRAVLGEAEISREAVARWARSFIDQQREHMRMEETVFFPEAERVLTAQDWRDLAARMTRPDDPVFGAQIGGRFETLRRTILAWQAQDEASTGSLQG